MNPQTPNNTQPAELSFCVLTVKNFMGYFIFFVSPTAASLYWGKLLHGDDSQPKPSSRQAQIRQQAFWTGMFAGPFLLFFICIFIVAAYLDYL